MIGKGYRVIDLERFWGSSKTSGHEKAHNAEIKPRESVREMGEPIDHGAERPTRPVESPEWWQD